MSTESTCYIWRSRQDCDTVNNPWLETNLLSTMADIEELKKQLEELKIRLEAEAKKAEEAKFETDEARSELKKALEEAKLQPKSVYIAPGRRLEVFRGSPIKSGDPSARDWSEDVRNHLALRHMSKAEEAAFIREHLAGNARKEILGRGPALYNSPNAILAVLVRVFGDGDTLPQLQQMFFSYRQAQSENLVNCSLHLVELYDQIVKLDSTYGSCRETSLKGRLAEAVLDQGLQRELRRLNQDAPSMDFFDLRDRAIDWLGKPKQQETTEATIKEVKVETSSMEYRIMQLLEKQAKQIEMQQKQIESLSKPSPYRRPRGDGRCFSCNQLGHIARNCTQQQRQQKDPASPSINTQQPSLN